MQGAFHPAAHLRPAAGDVDGVADGDRKFNDFSPSFVVAFDAAEHVNIYAKVVKGYKSGGYNIRASSPAAFISWNSSASP